MSVNPVPGIVFVIVAGEPQVLFIIEKTALPKLTVVTTRLAVPVFCSVTGIGLLVSPDGTWPKLILLGVNVAIGEVGAAVTKVFSSGCG